MTHHVSRPFKGVSAVERTATRRDQLLDGLLDVVLNVGCARVSVNNVCTAAGLTKRYFYESFESLDDLMSEAADRVFDDFYRDMLEIAEVHPSGHERFSAIVRAVVDRLQSDPRGARLYAESPGHPILRQRRDRAVERFSDFLTAGILEDPDESQECQLQVRLIISGTTEVITGFLDGSIETSPDEIVRVAASLMASVGAGRNT
jgi:AcrR family transcriptional regulator